MVEYKKNAHIELIKAFSWIMSKLIKKKFVCGINKISIHVYLCLLTSMFSFVLCETWENYGRYALLTDVTLSNL